MLCPAAKTHALELLHSKTLTLLSAYTLIVQRQRYILKCSLEVEQVERLKDEAYQLVSQTCALCLRLTLDESACQMVFAGIIGVENTEDIQKC